MTIDGVMEQFPVTREQIKAALEFAEGSLLENDRIVDR